MRVLHVIDGLGVGGGAEESLAGMLPGLRERGIDSSVVCLFERNGLEDSLRGQGFRVHVMSERRFVTRVLRLRRLIRNQSPDLVHASLITASFATRVACLGLHVTEIDSLVNTTYDPVRISQMGVHPRKFKALLAVDRLTSKWVNGGFHALTRAICDEAVDVLRIHEDRITIIPRGRDSQLMGFRTPERSADVRRGLGLSADDLVVLNVGRQDPQKAKVDLVKAFTLVSDQVPNAVLLIAGREGSSTDALARAVGDSPARDRIRVLGHRTDVPDLLAAADVFVFPSLYEGLGGAVVEAMGMACPIVASDAPALAEVLGYGEFGTVVARGDVQALADAMVRLLRDPKERDRLGKMARTRFESEYELDRVLNAMAELYRGFAVGKK